MNNNTIQTIQIENHCTYLSDSQYFKELPKNCLFDKGKTGCGGTTIAINSNNNTVIAVPFTSLIINKCSQHLNILGVYEGVTVSQIKAYINECEVNNKVPIIMTTYDSLYKVTQIIEPTNYDLLVDEYHLLFTQYSFRQSAIDSVLNQFRLYKSFCFMTATPLESDFILNELIDIPIVKAVWNNTITVTVNSVVCPNGVTNSTIDLVNSFLNGNEIGNLYLFVNSVQFIKDIVKECSLNIENTNCIYSKNNRTHIGIKRGVLPISVNDTVQPKKINILTSTVFEGTDIYDKSGRIFIVSDSNKTHTLIDISTSFQQIAGRIRNSDYIDNITHMYSTTRYSSLSYEDFKYMCDSEITTSKDLVSTLNNMPINIRKKITTNDNQVYVQCIDDIYSFNADLVKLDLYQYKVSRCLYSIRVNLNTELNKYGYNVNEIIHHTTTKISPNDLESFEKTVIKLESIWNLGTFTSEENKAYITAALTRYSFLLDAITLLGFDKIKELKYVVTNIKRVLIVLKESDNETKIQKMLTTYNGVLIGAFLSNKQLIDIFTKIYNQLDIKVAPKAKHINRYFNCIEKQIKRNKKVEHGFILGSKKVFIDKSDIEFNKIIAHIK